MGAKIFNSNLTKEIIEGARLQQDQGGVPSELAEKVIPVMEVNPKLLRQITIIKQGTAGGTIYTTPSDKDFYLVAFNHTAYSSTVGLSTSNLRVTLDGGTSVSVISKIDLFITALIDSQCSSDSNNFPYPIKLKRGTVIELTTVGTPVRSATIYGFLVDNTNA